MDESPRTGLGRSSTVVRAGAVLASSAVAAALLAGVAGCARLAKVFSTRVHVLGESYEPGPELLYVMYDPDGDAGKDLPRHYVLPKAEHGKHLRPPRLLHKGVIEMWAPDPSRDLEIRYYVKNDPYYDGDFKEVVSVIGEIRGAVPNELVFLEDVFPKRKNPFRFVVADLANPHAGVVLGHADLILIRVEDRKTHEVQKFVFEYVEDGLKIGVYTNLLLSTGLAATLREPRYLVRHPPRLADRFTTTDALGANFTFSFALGWRSTRPRGVLKWLGDNFSVISSFGIGAVNAFDPLSFRFDFALVTGGGFQLFDMISLQVLSNVTGSRDGSAAFSSAFLAVGFDVVAAARFGRRLGSRLFADTSIESFEDH